MVVSAPSTISTIMATLPNCMMSRGGVAVPVAESNAIYVGSVGAVQIADPPGGVDQANFGMPAADGTIVENDFKCSQPAGTENRSDSQTLPFTSPLMPRNRIGCFMAGLPLPTTLTVWFGICTETGFDCNMFRTPEKAIPSPKPQQI